MNRWNGPAESAGLTGWFTTLIFCRAARPYSEPYAWLPDWLPAGGGSFGDEQQEQRRSKTDEISS